MASIDEISTYALVFDWVMTKSVVPALANPVFEG
jgi:hypothetical protein